MSENAGSALTDAQAKNVAESLKGSTKNVYFCTKIELGRALTREEMDPTVQHIEAVGKVFKCAGCGTWFEDSEASAMNDEVCSVCYDEDEEF